MEAAAEVNKVYFDDEALRYDTKHAKTNQQLMEAIRARLDFIGVDWVEDEEGEDGDDEDDDDNNDNNAEQAVSREVRLLDYACGTGMVSRALAPYTTKCVGIDISENMVAAYNGRAENQGLSKDEMFAVRGDLAVVSDPNPAALSGPEFFGFDLAAVGGGFHHFGDPELAAKRIVERLRSGGVLVIWDFLPHEVNHHKASHTVTHHGFSEEHIKEIFVNAGAGKNYALEELGSGIVFQHGADSKSMKRRVFLARGEKA